MSFNLAHIEIEEIRLPELNSCKLFTPEFLFLEKESIKWKTEEEIIKIKQTEEMLSVSEGNDDHEERESSEKKEDINIRKVDKERGEKREEEIDAMRKDSKENSQIQVKKLKKVRKNGGLLRKNSDTYQIIEKNLTDSVEVETPAPKKNPLHFLRIIKSIASAINKLRAKSKFRPLKFFSSKHFEVLNDKSNFLDSSGKGKDHLKMLLAKNELIRIAYKLKIFSTKTKIYQICSEKLKQFAIIFEEKIPVIHPDHFIKIIWNFIIILIFLFLFLSYPIQICFQLSHFWVEYYIEIERNMIEIFFAVLYGTHCLIKLNQAFYEKGMLVKVRTLILKNYIKNELLCDILGSIPISIELILSFNPENSVLLDIRSYAQVLFFSKILEVKRITRFLEETLHLNDKYFAFFQLFKLMITLLLFLNIMACLWHGISFYSPFPKNMMQSSNYNTKDWQSRYLKTLFWTVNAGRIDPQNDLELFFGFFALLATSGSMGFLISGIHNLMRILGKNAEEKRENMRKINLYMQNKKIDFDLQGKVRKYVNYLQEISTTDSEIEKDIINKLNPSLKEELLIRANGRIIKGLPFFSKNFSEKTLRKLVFVMKPNRFYPEEFICEEGDEEEKKLYLIADGEVCLLKSDSQIKLATLQKGDMFGLYDILNDSKGHSQTVMSLGFTSIYTITSSELIRILKEIPTDYETFCFLKDKFLWEKNLELSHLKCYACNLKSHFIINCPRLHYQPDPSFIILKHLHSKPIEQRTPFNARRRRKINARGNLTYLRIKMLSVDVEFKKLIKLMDDCSTPNEENDECLEEKEEDSLFYEEGGGRKREYGGKGKKEDSEEEESGKSSEEIGGEVGLRRKDIRDFKLMPEENFYEEGENGNYYGTRKTVKLTQTLIDNNYIEKEDGMGGGGRGLRGKKKSTKMTQNHEGSIDGEKSYWDRREKSKFTYNFSEKCASEITTNEGIENQESRVVKAYSKQEQLLNRFDKMKSYNIYYPEYNIENIIDYLDLQRKKMNFLKKKKNVPSTQVEILTNYLSPIREHQKKRTTIINPDSKVMNVKKDVSFKKISTFLAAN